jgi:beta-lactamase regulating signal transducer with metallopeptidase domain
VDNYFYVNVSIAFAVLMIIRYGKGSSNANYYLSSMAIAAWFIPYPLLAELIPAQVLVEPIIVSFSTLNATVTTNGGQSLQFDINSWLKWGLWGLVSFGVLLFIKQLVDCVRWRRQVMTDPSLNLLNEISAKHHLPVYSVNQVDSGLLLGLFKPVIIISNQINDPKHIDLIIAHEQQHIKNHDNFRLLLLELSECLFWWNPLVRKLVNMNRFLIEVRCDENASKDYGKMDYINDLTSLILSKYQDKPSNLICSATSNGTNNVARIKLLKEKRYMTFNKKLTYAVIALATITTMSWTTLATAINNEQVQHLQANQKQLGALIDFDVKIITEKTDETQNAISANMTIWADFDGKASFKINEEFAFNFQVTDSGEYALLDIELIEVGQGNEKMIANPKLAIEFGKQGIIEIDNPQVSNNIYRIKAKPVKAVRPK